MTDEQQAVTVLDTWQRMIELVPVATDDDALQRIIAMIADAQAPQDLDRPWRVQGMADYLDTEIEIRRVRQAPSDFAAAGSLGVYLIVEGVALATGEAITATTGAVSVVAQLVRACAIGALPLRVIPRQSERASANGYYPQHLEVLAAQPALEH